LERHDHGEHAERDDNAYQEIVPGRHGRMITCVRCLRRTQRLGPKILAGCAARTAPSFAICMRV
jgi:hypothetical protein